MILKHQDKINKFYEWRKQNQLLVEELEVTQSQKLNLSMLSEDEVDSVTDHTYDDLSKLE